MTHPVTHARHETTHGQQALGVSFAQTQALWRKTTGQAMVNQGRRAPGDRELLGGRGPKSNTVGACGSCAFHLDHGQLSHGATEQAEIDSVTETLGVDGTSTWADENIDSLSLDTVCDPVTVSRTNKPTADRIFAHAPARWNVD